MGGHHRKKWFKFGLAILLTALVIAFFRRSKVAPHPRQRRHSRLTRLYLRLVDLFNRRVLWHKLPLPLAVINFIGMRLLLRDQNLYDTEILPGAAEDEAQPDDKRYLRARSADGTYNDLDYPKMGSPGTRFGRNVPLEVVSPDRQRLLTPSPRTISRELLTRHQFQPATTLNLLAAAWLQFMVHDWLSHGKNDKDRLIELPLAADDPWYENPMVIPATRLAPPQPSDPPNLPPTYTNTETSWWDGSQIYGSSQEIQARVRSGEAGKLRIDQQGLLPVDPETGIEISGVTGNWWLGLSLMHTLFTLEHNAICDRLKAVYPKWSDDILFDYARLINVALMAKIHTVEWTTGILNTPALRIAMRANWWGVVGEKLYRALGRISPSETLSGIPGSPTDHHGALYAMTEEFTAVYRMHPLIPDEFSLRSAGDNRLIRACTFREVAGRHARSRLEEISTIDLLYSFGTSHPGAITLHNYPRFLQELEKQESGQLVDLATIDILRDRERGVPRYNEFRRLVHKPPVKSFEELTTNPDWAEEIRRVYDNDIDLVDLMVGLYAEPTPPGFGFSDTAFRIFILMASRRLKSDRFFTTDYTPNIYTPVGLAWIDDNTMSSVLLRHFPGLEPQLQAVANAFAPWPAAKS